MTVAAHNVTCHYANDTYITTQFNGTQSQANEYFLGKLFNLGDTDECPSDDMVMCTAVVFEA